MITQNICWDDDKSGLYFSDRHSYSVKTFLPELKPGETIRVKSGTLGSKADFAPSLRQLGFTAKESTAFDILCSKAILTSGKLLYRMPQNECQRLTRLDFYPRPQKISRVLYVLLKE